MELKVGHVTLYAQLARILRDQIYTGVWKEGEEIPTLKELVSRFNVARVTVRQAVQILSDEGLLSSQRGRRTFVSYKSPSAKPLYSSVGSIDSDPSALSTKILTRRKVESPPRSAERDGIFADSYILIQKVDSQNSIPYAYSECYVEMAVFRRIPQGSEKKVKLFRLVRDYAQGLPLKATERITLSIPEPDEAKLLRMPTSSPVARVARIIKDKSDTILLYGNFIYRGDHFCIERDISDILISTR